MTRQKRFFAALLALLLALALAACGASDPAPTPPDDPDPPVDPAAETISVELVGNFSNGAPNAIELGLYKYLDVEIPAPVTAEALAEELTAWSGLDFFINSATVDGNKITVDWSKDSTLIAGLDNREFQEDFQFFDAVSLNFFMMDSLASTIEGNLGITEIYYTMDGGQPLVTSAMEDMEAQGFFEMSSDIPYMGSGFFQAHNDVMGD